VQLEQLERARRQRTRRQARANAGDTIWIGFAPWQGEGRIAPLPGEQHELKPSGQPGRSHLRCLSLMIQMILNQGEMDMKTHQTSNRRSGMLSVLALAFATAGLAPGCGGSGSGSDSCLAAGIYSATYVKQAGSSASCPALSTTTATIGAADAGSSSCPSGCTCVEPAENACSGTISQTCPSGNPAGNVSCTFTASGNTANGSCTFTTSTLTCNYNITLTKP
jgi:hypothetical protein